MELPRALLSQSLKNKKKPCSEKIFYYLLIFSKKVFLIFPEMELSSRKNKKFQEGIFRSGKIKEPPLKKLLIFRETELSSPKLKNLYFRREFPKPEKQTKKSALKKFLVANDVFTMLTAIKHKQIPCEAKIQHRDITL